MGYKSQTKIVAGEIIVVGPHLLLRDHDFVLSYLSPLLEQGKANNIVFFSKNLMSSMIKELSSSINIVYYWNYVDLEKLRDAHHFCWKTTRNWFKTPEIVSSLQKEFHIGISPAYLDELDTFQKIVRPVRDIVHLQFLFELTPACQSYIFMSSSPSFLRLTKLVKEQCFAERQFTIKNLLVKHPTEAFVKSARLTKFLLLSSKILKSLILDTLNYSRRRRSVKMKHLYHILSEFHRITNVLISQKDAMFSRGIRPIFLTGPLDVSTKRLLLHHNIPFVNGGSLFSYLKDLLFPNINPKKRSILPNDYNIYYCGIALFENCDGQLLADIRKKIARWKRRLRKYSRIIEKFKIKCVVTSSYVSDNQKLIFHAAEEHNVPSVSLQHGMLSKTKVSCDIIYSDYYMAWGPIEVVEFKRVNEGNRGKIKVIGPMVYDKINRMKRELPSKTTICHELGIPVSNKIVLYAPPDDSGIVWSPVSPYDLYERQALAVIDALKKKPNTTLVIKTHSMHNSTLFERSTTKASNIALLRDYDIYRIIGISDCVLITGSTVGLDAIHWKVPIIQLALHDIGQPLIYAEYGAALAAYNEKDLYDKIDLALNEPQVKTQLIDGQKRMMRDYAWPLDGMARQRFVEFIDQLLSR